MHFLDGIPFHHLCILALLFALSLKATSTKRSVYTIHMDQSLMPMAFSNRVTWYSSIVGTSLSSTSSASSNLSSTPPLLIYTYNYVIHGFSAFLSFEELQTLKKIPGFLIAHKSVTSFTLYSTYTPEYLKLNHENGIWPISNYGNDVAIGIFDTGIWPESPSFNDIGMTNSTPSKWNGSCERAGEGFKSSLCNFKLIGAKYFNEGFKRAKPGRKLTIKDSARDIDGHGTFVSSIAAGNYVNGVSYFGYAKGTAKGIAPRARLAVYTVVWDFDVITSDDILAAMEQAIADGVDVISASIGDPVSTRLEKNSLAIASFSAMERGILVVCAAGNSGPKSRTVDNGFPWVLTVGASTTDRWFAGILTLGGKNITGWSLFPGNVSLQNMPLVNDKHLSTCESKNSLSNAPNGSIIVCTSGSIRSQLFALSEANVTGAILFSDNPTSLEFEKFRCPCIVLSSNDKPFVFGYIENEKETARASITFQQTIKGTHPSPSVAKYSARGPSMNYMHLVKPDVIAPGSLILGAANPTLEVGGIGSEPLFNDYTMKSGTSMACPHVAGVAALLKAKHPKWSPAAIRSAIITTANHLDITLNPIRDNHYVPLVKTATPLDMGAGFVDPNRALDPGLIYDATAQDYVNLLCSLKLPKEDLSSFIKSNSYDCSNSSDDLNYPSFLVFYDRLSTLMVREFQRTVTNVGEGAATYTVSVTTPYDSEVQVLPEKLEFRTKYEKQSYNVSIKYKSDDLNGIYFGDIVWVEENRKHKVRSPIVVTHYYS